MCRLLLEALACEALRFSLRFSNRLPTAPRRQRPARSYGPPTYGAQDQAPARPAASLPRRRTPPTSGPRRRRRPEPAGRPRRPSSAARAYRPGPRRQLRAEGPHWAARRRRALIGPDAPEAAPVGGGPLLRPLAWRPPRPASGEMAAVVAVVTGPGGG